MSARRPALMMMMTAACLAGCASFHPAPIDSVPFKERAQTQTEHEVTVTAAVLSAQETKAVFGAPLYGRGIQPVWLAITNDGDVPVWYLPTGTDRAYFPPLEVAYMHKGGFSGEAQEAMNRYYHDAVIGKHVAPSATRSGFIFTNLDEGTKAFNVDVIVEGGELRTLTFFIEVPGLRPDHREVDFDALYDPGERRDLDEAGLIEALESLPCCVTDKDAAGQGDPVNLVVIGDADEVFQAFLRAGWDETETIYAGSALKTGVSFLFGGKYRYSPVSALYLFGRGQDIALQKARDTIHERNHLRLWLSPLVFEGEPVWVGQISRDIGVRFTMKTITTHKIDPDVDETREYLLEDLWYSNTLRKFAYVGGVQEAPIDSPRANLTGDPYFTDGSRLVLWLSGKPVELTDVEVINWRRPPER